jgi:hypothetical protein
MLARWSIRVVILGAMVVWVTSCGEQRRERQVGTTVAGYIAPEAEAPTLQRIGQRAQEIILAAADDNWPRIYAYLAEVRDAWQDYQRPTAVPPSSSRSSGTLLYGRLDAALARLRAAAAAQAKGATMRAANDVDAAALDLFEYYNPAIPSDLHRLRVLEQRVVLDATDGRIDAVAATLKEARDAWRRVRATVTANSSPSVTAAFETNLRAQEAALRRGDSEELAAQARQAMDLIQGMQRLSYEKVRRA